VVEQVVMCPLHESGFRMTGLALTLVALTLVAECAHSLVC